MVKGDTAWIQVQIFNYTVNNTDVILNISASGSNVTNITTYESRRFFYDTNMTIYSAFFQVLVDMKFGIFSSAIYSSSCSKNKCIAGGKICVKNTTDCGIERFPDKIPKNKPDPNVKVYIAWKGTDLMGVSMQSEGLLPNRYTSFALPWISWITQFAQSVSK
jgi:hypothetical protein